MRAKRTFRFLCAVGALLAQERRHVAVVDAVVVVELGRAGVLNEEVAVGGASVLGAGEIVSTGNVR